ncbi:DUF5320 domain-containing protein [Nanoarchaeota archaeon]
MPNFDGTGPEGKGKRTGRGLGKCKGDDARIDDSRPRRVRAGFAGRRRPGCRRAE